MPTLNIYLPNELNRIGELSETEQLRLASNSVKLADVPELHTPVAEVTQPQRHAMSLPLTGAVFDILVDVFQEMLVRDGLISRELDVLSRRERTSPDAFVQAEFDRAYAGRHYEFKRVLLDAQRKPGLQDLHRNVERITMADRIGRVGPIAGGPRAHAGRLLGLSRSGRRQDAVQMDGDLARWPVDNRAERSAAECRD